MRDHGAALGDAECAVAKKFEITNRRRQQMPAGRMVSIRPIGKKTKSAAILPAELHYSEKARIAWPNG